MLYAGKLADAEAVELDKRTKQPWFDYQPSFVPFGVPKPEGIKGQSTGVEISGWDDLAPVIESLVK